MNIYTDTM